MSGRIISGGLNAFFYKVKRKVRGIIKNNDPFHLEKQMLKGKHVTSNKNPSIIHFSINKSATQYVKGLLREICEAEGMTHVRFNEFAFNSNLPFLDHLSEGELKEYYHIFKPRGYLYSAFGGYIPGIPKIENYKVILLIRDPRDILVSDYFSISYSHNPPPENSDKYADFMEKRNKALKVDINEYVIQASDRVLDDLNKYVNGLLSIHREVHLSKYEDMVRDHTGWMQAIVDYCGLPVDQQLMDKIQQEASTLKPKEEDIHAHVRKGTYGDYKSKLNVQTINLLNKKFGDVLEKFGYEIT